MTIEYPFCFSNEEREQRRCINCSKDATYVSKKGTKYWYRTKGGWHCHRCHNRALKR